MAEGLSGLLGAYAESDDESNNSPFSTSPHHSPHAATDGILRAAGRVGDAVEEEKAANDYRMNGNGEVDEIVGCFPQIGDHVKAGSDNITDSVDALSRERPRDEGGTAPETDPNFSLLPPELQEAPPGEADPALQAKIVSWVHIQQSQGRSLNTEIRKSRGYQNPFFFKKMIEHYDISEYGTCLAPSVWDPAALPPEDRLEALRGEVQELRRRTERERAQTGRVAFVPGGAQHQAPPGPARLPANAAAAAAIAQAQARAAALARSMAQRR